MIITMNELSKLYAAKLLETGSHDQAMLHVWWVAYNTDRPEGWAKKQFTLKDDFVPEMDSKSIAYRKLLDELYPVGNVYRVLKDD